jgi:AGZA family xanthine/uracil permease-like MFS transporter
MTDDSLTQADPTLTGSEVDIGTELFAGLGTFLTMSYILLLNPVLLHKTGIDISAAFFATVASAAVSTLIMGLWAKLPFAVAPAPSLTTFFVSYVCLTLGLPWQAAMGVVVASGFISIGAAALAIRGKIIDRTPLALKIGIIFAVGGFLIANGLSQAKLIKFEDGLLDFHSINLSAPTLVIPLVGLVVTLVFRGKWLKFNGAPLLGILAATLAAIFFGIRATTQASLGPQMFSAVNKIDWSVFLNWHLYSAMFVFFIIDFFGGVGKFMGLFAALDGKLTKDQVSKGMGKALYVDGLGNIVGGFLGASSLAVFISSAVGISVGGRTGLTAVFTAIFIAASLFAIPLVGSIPVEATSGILVFVGLILVPWASLRRGDIDLDVIDYLVFAVAAGAAFFTFALDRSLLLLFAVYSLRVLLKGFSPKDWTLYVVTLLLGAAVIADLFLR